MGRPRGSSKGSVIDLGNGKFEAQITIDGQRFTKTVTSKTMANDWFADLKVDARKGLLPTDAKITVGEWLDEFYRLKEQQNRKPRQLQHLDWAIRNHLKPTLGHLKLADLKASDLDRLYRDRLAGKGAKGEKPMAPTSVHHLHAVIHHALEVAIRKGYLARNVAVAADPPPVKVKPKTVWTSEQIVTFYGSLHDHRLAAAFLTAVACGLRASEIAGLRWDDFDVQRGILHIRRNRQRVWKRGVLEDTPKTKHAERPIILPTQVFVELESWRQRQQAERNYFGYPDTGYVFTYPRTGTPIDNNQFHKEFDTFVSKLQLPPITPHELRHTCATLLMEENVNLTAVQALLGHSDPATTSRIYQHFQASLHGYQTKQAMERVLGGTQRAIATEQINGLEITNS